MSRVPRLSTNGDAFRMSCAVFAHRYQLARSALPRSSCRRINVVRYERMSLRAMGFGTISRAVRVTAHYVLAYRRWLKVRWIHAVPDTTKMVEDQSFWNRAHEQFVRNTVRAFFPSSSIARGHATVAVPILFSLPDPATPVVGRGYFSPKLSGGVQSMCRHSVTGSVPHSLERLN